MNRKDSREWIIGEIGSYAIKIHTNYYNIGIIIVGKNRISSIIFEKRTRIKYNTLFMEIEF